MTAAEVEAMLLVRYGVRAGPAVQAYVVRQVMAGRAGAFPILAGDARTGRPVRQLVAAADLRADAVDAARWSTSGGRP